MDTLFGDLEPEVNPGWEYVLKLLADKDVAKYICDAKGFYHSGIQLVGNIWDASLMGYLLNPASNKYTMPELMHSYDAGVHEPVRRKHHGEGRLKLQGDTRALLPGHDTFVKFKF